MGKAVKESRSDVERCAWTIEYFACHGKIFANDQVMNTHASYALELSLLSGIKICCSFAVGW
jgi:hypothetical protein